MTYHPILYPKWMQLLIMQFFSSRPSTFSFSFETFHYAFYSKTHLICILISVYCGSYSFKTHYITAL
jgi:hypothetical protein